MNITTIIKNCLPYGISNYFIKKKSRLQQEIPSSEEPPVYNKEGEKLKTVFLSSIISDHYPYCLVTGRYPRWILWDRNNYGLKNHFYVHEKILFPQGKPEKKFALFFESEAIVPKDYTLFYQNPGIERDFSLIFTHSAKLLDKYPNAVFIPAYGVWYGTALWGGQCNPLQYELKTKNISMLSSSKIMCDLHKFRVSLAKYYKNSLYIDTYGTFNGGNKIELAIPFERYRYSIVIENNISPYYFTEKILNCFASMTIPIYIGAIKINKFFNIDGIIQVSNLDYDTFDKIIKNCNEYEYNLHIPAIIDNYNRVQKFLCIEDYMWEHYHVYFT